MLRVLLALALLLPSVAHARGHARKSHDGEVWPPPEPVTTGPDDDKPKKDPPPKKDDAPKKDEGDPYQLDPSLTDGDAPPPAPKAQKPSDGDDGEAQKPAANQDDDDDACADHFDDCKEDCSIAHTNDDTLHVKGKLPIARCLSKCTKKYNLCEEQRENGFDPDDKSRDN